MGARDAAARRPVRAVIHLHAAADLGDAAVIGRLLDALEGHARFSPTHWGTDERIRLDYDRAEVLGRASQGGAIRQVLLHRKKSVKYEGHFDARKGSFVSFLFDDSLDAASWTNLLVLADQIAEVLRPRFGVVHRFLSTPSPWENDEQRVLTLMDFVAQPVPVRFNASGPLGLAMRTYLDADIADLFGRDLLLSTPAVVDELGWGGIRIESARGHVGFAGRRADRALERGHGPPGAQRGARRGITAQEPPRLRVRPVAGVEATRQEMRPSHAR